MVPSLGDPHWHGAKESRPGTFGIILLVTGGLALLARRRYPGAVLAIVLAAAVGRGAEPGGRGCCGTATTTW
jgi:hypothetical protein